MGNIEEMFLVTDWTVESLINDYIIYIVTEKKSVSKGLRDIVIIILPKQSFVYYSLTIINIETILQDFLEILKQKLLNYWKIIKISSSDWNIQLHNNMSPVYKGLTMSMHDETTHKDNSS